jgi:hypothetical protein
LNGSDTCGEGVKYLLPSSLPHGSLNTNALPNVTYTPTATNFTGVDSFNYVVTSSCGGDTATSSVTIYMAGGPNLTLGCDPFGTGTYVLLEWSLGTNESQMQQQLNNISDYKIYRSAVSGGPYTCIGTNNGASQTTYTDTNVVAGETNYYVATFEFSGNSTTCESPFSNEIEAVVPSAYDLIAPDATWDVWDVTVANQPPVWKGELRAPFSSQYPGQYPDLNPWPNTYWPAAAGEVYSMWSNNIALVLPADWTNQTQLAQVKYSIAIDNDYWLYLNHSTNCIDAIIHEGDASWPAFKSFEDVAPGLLHGGTNLISVVIRDRESINYFSIVVTTNTCGQ